VTIPARYIGRESASEDEREMIVLSRSKNAASMTFMVSVLASVPEQDEERRERAGPSDQMRALG
jgi:hypothetical protein